jgi:hypothetical protein
MPKTFEQWMNCLGTYLENKNVDVSPIKVAETVGDVPIGSSHLLTLKHNAIDSIELKYSDDPELRFHLRYINKLFLLHSQGRMSYDDLLATLKSYDNMDNEGGFEEAVENNEYSYRGNYIPD